jgi:hypothetical protein
MASEEQNVNADYDDYHRDHVKRGNCFASHHFPLLRDAASESVIKFHETLARQTVCLDQLRLRRLAVKAGGSSRVTAPAW